VKPRVPLLLALAAVLLGCVTQDVGPFRRAGGEPITFLCTTPSGEPLEGTGNRESYVYRRDRVPESTHTVVVRRYPAACRVSFWEDRPALAPVDGQWVFASERLVRWRSANHTEVEIQNAPGGFDRPVPPFEELKPLVREYLKRHPSELSG
jgi:hypothetical protein